MFIFNVLLSVCIGKSIFSNLCNESSKIFHFFEAFICFCTLISKSAVVFNILLSCKVILDENCNRILLSDNILDELLIDSLFCNVFVFGLSKYDKIIIAMIFYSIFVQDFACNFSKRIIRVASLIFSI